MSELNLKPCPFCGSKDALKMAKQYGVNGWRDTYYVLCDYEDGGCGATGGMRHYQDEASECWNTRAGDADAID